MRYFWKRLARLIVFIEVTVLYVEYISFFLLAKQDLNWFTGCGTLTGDHYFAFHFIFNVGVCCSRRSDHILVVSIVCNTVTVAIRAFNLNKLFGKISIYAK